MMRKSVNLFFFLNLFLIHASAQEFLGDTSYKASPDFAPCKYIFFNPYFEGVNDQVYQVDTLLHQFQRYDATLRSENIYATLGQTGQAHTPMNFNKVYTPFFSYKTVPYPEYYKTLSKIKLYEGKNPYSRLYWATGLGKENIFEALHAQNIKDFYLGFNLDAATNTGRYTRQSTNRINFDVQLGYHLPNHLWGVFATYILNHFQIPSSSLKSHQYYMLNYVDFSGVSKNKRKTGVFTHSFDCNGWTDKYQDSILDLSKYYTITNQLQYSNYRFNEQLPEKDFIFRYAFGFSHQYTHIYYFKDDYQTFRPSFNLFLKLRKYTMGADGSYSIHGYNHKNYHLQMKLGLRLDTLSKHKIGLTAGAFSRAPDYMMNYYSGNYSLWQNQLKNEQVYTTAFNYQFQKYGLEFRYFLVKNHSYLDVQSQPAQIENAFSLIQAHLLVPFRVKGFCVDLNAYTQYTPETCVNIPYFAMQSSIYYGFKVFKKKLELQIGFNIDYNTPYYAQSYNSNLRQFYRQTDYKLGNYMYSDVFLNFKILRLNAFIMCTQYLGGIMGSHYITTPYYPMEGTSVKFGVAWRFYD